LETPPHAGFVSASSQGAHLQNATHAFFSAAALGWKALRRLRNCEEHSSAFRAFWEDICDDQGWEMAERKKGQKMLLKLKQ
jgi:hypothetical protein